MFDKKTQHWVICLKLSKTWFKNRINIDKEI